MGENREKGSVACIHNCASYGCCVMDLDKKSRYAILGKLGAGYRRE